MGEMADGDLVLFIHIGEEESLVVDPEGEYAVLFGDGKGGAVNSAVGGSSDGFKCKTLEGREHGEL